MIRSFLLSLLLLATSLTSTLSFVVDHRTSACVVAGERQQSQPKSFMKIMASSGFEESTQQQQIITANWRQLPSKGPKEVPITKEDLSIEIIIGRVAMVGFIGLLVREIVSGEKFSEQFIDIVNFLETIH